MTKNEIDSMHDECSEHALLMSSQRTVGSLNKVLLSIVSNLFTASEFRIYCNAGKAESQNIYLYGHNEHRFSVSRDIQLIDDFAINGEVPTNEGILFFPAIFNDRIVACIISSEDVPEQISDLLISIIAIYCNILHLISDSRIDGLTGLLNRKSFDLELIEELNAAVYNKRRKSDEIEPQLSSYLAIADIDFFKNVNDQHGHLIGDEVLLKMAQTINKSFRDHDSFFRYGGEEFAMILRNVNHSDALQILERFAQIIRDTVFPTVASITISIGFTEIRSTMMPTQIIEMADKALYYSKDNGRDQVADFQQLELAGKLSLDTIKSEIELF